MRFFICSRCQFTFVDRGTPLRCPDCGKAPVRPATREEIARHVNDMREEGLVGLPRRVPA